MNEVQKEKMRNYSRNYYATMSEEKKEHCRQYRREYYRKCMATDPEGYKKKVKNYHSQSQLLIIVKE